MSSIEKATPSGKALPSVETPMGVSIDHIIFEDQLDIFVTPTDPSSNPIDNEAD